MTSRLTIRLNYDQQYSRDLRLSIPSIASFAMQHWVADTVETNASTLQTMTVQYWTLNDAIMPLRMTMSPKGRFSENLRLQILNDSL